MAGTLPTDASVTKSASRDETIVAEDSPAPLNDAPSDLEKAPATQALSNEPGAKWRDKEVHDIPYK